MQLVPTGFSIREAHAADLPGVLDLAKRSGFPIASADFTQRVEEIFRQTNHRIFLAIDDAGKVRAWLHVHVRLGVETDPSGELGSFVLDAECRRSKLGIALVAEAERWCVHVGCFRLVTRVPLGNQDAHDFYAHQGFSQIKEQKVMQRLIRR
jgi:N-acetylglutamate synthase-like GNAT family acetyltransferase